MSNSRASKSSSFIKKVPELKVKINAGSISENNIVQKSLNSNNLRPPNFMTLPSYSSNSPLPSLKPVEHPVMSKINLYGFEIAPRTCVNNLSPKRKSKKLKEKRTKETEKLNKWLYFTKNWQYYSKSRNKLKYIIRKGIPDSLRGDIWYSLSKAEKLRIKEPKIYGEYIKNGKLKKEIDVQICKDLCRTFPSNVYLQKKSGQRALYNVLKGIALHVEEVGYCQGMGFIVASLLMYMGEEDAFWVMISLLNGRCRLKDMLKDGLPLTRQRLFVLDLLVEAQIPALHRHFKKESFFALTYANKWLIAIFCTSVPFSITVRVIDVLLNEGFKVIFRVSLAILNIAKKDLLKLNNIDMLDKIVETTHELGENPDMLMNYAFNHIKLKRETIDRMAQKFSDQ